ELSSKYWTTFSTSTTKITLEDPCPCTALQQRAIEISATNPQMRPVIIRLPFQSGISLDLSLSLVHFLLLRTKVQNAGKKDQALFEPDVAGLFPDRQGDFVAGHREAQEAAIHVRGR